MRVSTAMFQQIGTASMELGQSNLFQTQEQLSTGRSFNSAGDNPLAAEQAVSVAAASAVNSQYTANQGQAQSHLSLAESTLASVENVLQSARQSLVQAGSGSLNSSDRQTIAQQLQTNLNQLLSLANTQDTNGAYLFAGYNQGTMPFSATATGAQYNGDQGVRYLQVGSSANMAVSVNGAAVFQMVRNGNGTFAVSASGANTGTGTVDQGSVTDSSQLTGDSYSIQFAGSGAASTYSVVDTTTATTVAGPTAYVAGNAIRFAGMQVTVSGAPAAGDSFTVAPAQNQDMFTTLQNAITALGSSQGTPAQQAAFTNQLGASLSNVSQALNSVITARSQVGANLSELTTLGTQAQSANVNFQTQMSNLTNVDYASAVSQYMAEQLAYQAAQSSYAQVSKLSLFSQL